ncbi:MAG: ABC transporter permease [Niameybacter sp.]|uniref:ABC transporter permease n=1 Tax=Niameybacter sp. TaxID=2033640 RepID=UPI002FCC5990
MGKCKKVFRKIFEMNTILLSVISLGFAIVISGIIMALCGYNPFEAFGAMFVGAFGSQRAIAQTLTQATPLIFTGLAFTFAKKATLINLGIEGQLQMGAMAAAIVGAIDLGLPMALHLPLALVAGMIAGGLYAGFVGFLKVKFGSNEVIATIMLNSIAIYFVSYLANYPLKVEGAVAQTSKVMETAMLPRIFSKYQLTLAIFIAIAACILVKYFMQKTRLGYEMRCVGMNSTAAETAGIKIGKIMMIAMFISGAIAGLAGAGQVLGVDRRFIDGFSPGYGFDGIAVAALAADNPIGVIFAGIIFGALRAGSMVLNRTTNIPTDFVNVIQALVVLFVAAPMLVKAILRINDKKVAAKENK